MLLGVTCLNKGFDFDGEQGGNGNKGNRGNRREQNFAIEETQRADAGKYVSKVSGA